MSTTKLRSTSVTINDVAALAGVSKKTVSRVINKSEMLRPATRERVERAIAELAFVPNPQARALALRRNMLIAVLHDNPNAQMILMVQRGVLSVIKDSDLALAVRPVDRASPGMMADIETFLVKQRPLGVILLPPISERDELAELCQRLGVRYVRIGSAPLDMASRCVCSNDREIVQQAVRHLIAMGHRRLGLVRGPEGFRSADERQQGFFDALAEAGIAAVPEWIETGTYRFPSGREAGLAILDRADRPTAIFSSNDEMAAGVMHAAHELGLRLPEDLTVVGLDDSPVASQVWPPLSSVHWPIEEMAQIAARKLVPEFLPGEPVTDPVGPVPSSLVWRASLAPPRPD